MMNRSDLSTYSIDDWENEFSSIYGNIDLKRTPTEIWLLLVEDASKVAECIRNNWFSDAIDALAHVFCWTTSFIWRIRSSNALEVKIKKPLSEIVWYKYPRLCPACANKHCICSFRRAEKEEFTREEKEKYQATLEDTLNIARERREEMPRTLDEYQAMFKEIYWGSHYTLPIESVAFHFMEEVGEVSSCIRGLRERKISSTKASEEKLIRNLDDEIADVISWTMSLTLKLDFMLGAGYKFWQVYFNDNVKAKQTANLNLSEILWKAYQTPDGNSLYCRRCGDRPCTCVSVSL